MRFFVNGIRARIVVGGVIIFSILSVLFPRSVGLVVGLVIGLLIMVMEQFGLKMGNWGREFGGLIGHWAIGLGEWIGSLAIGFAEIIEGINLLRSIQMLGSFMIIITGLVVIWLLPRSTRS